LWNLAGFGIYWTDLHLDRFILLKSSHGFHKNVLVILIVLALQIAPFEAQ
jgi:hypothetical protein